MNLSGPFSSQWHPWLPSYGITCDFEHVPYSVANSCLTSFFFCLANSLPPPFSQPTLSHTPVLSSETFSSKKLSDHSWPQSTVSFSDAITVTLRWKYTCLFVLILHHDKFPEGGWRLLLIYSVLYFAVSWIPQKWSLKWRVLSKCFLEGVLSDKTRARGGQLGVQLKSSLNLIPGGALDPDDTRVATGGLSLYHPHPQ